MPLTVVGKSSRAWVQLFHLRIVSPRASFSITPPGYFANCHEFAARLIPIFAYYDAFTLLHIFAVPEMRAVLEKIDRSNFNDDLPKKTGGRSVDR